MTLLGYLVLLVHSITGLVKYAYFYTDTCTKCAAVPHFALSTDCHDFVRLVSNWIDSVGCFLYNLDMLLHVDIPFWEWFELDDMCGWWLS